MEFTVDQKLMALSWKQPYASLMLHGKIETRTWSTAYRGWVLICASKTPYPDWTVIGISGGRDGLQAIRDKLSFAPKTKFKDMILGHAIAIARLVDCRPMQPEDAEKAFVEYYPDLFCHVYEDVKQIIPIPWKGTQGWKEVSMEIKKDLAFLLPFTLPEEYRDLAGLTMTEIIYGEMRIPIRYHRFPDPGETKISDAEDTDKA